MKGNINLCLEINAIVNYGSSKETLFWFHRYVFFFFYYNHSEPCLLYFLILCHNLLYIWLSTPQVPLFLVKEYFSLTRTSFCFSFELAILQFYFQMQCFHMIYTFYLLSFKFLTITFETYNDIDSRSKVLLKLYSFPQEELVN